MPVRGRNRHGHGVRGPITGPELPLLTSRINEFEQIIASRVDYFSDMWSEELAGLRIEISAAPPQALTSDRVRYWTVNKEKRLVTFFRVPIERFLDARHPAELERHMAIESCVYAAIGDYLGLDHWKPGPGFSR